jgi:hypothetical protein
MGNQSSPSVLENDLPPKERMSDIELIMKQQLLLQGVTKTACKPILQIDAKMQAEGFHDNLTLENGHLSDTTNIFCCLAYMNR